MATSNGKGHGRVRKTPVPPPSRALTPEEVQAEIDRIDAGGTAWRDDDEEVDLDIKVPFDKVVPVRLNDDLWKALRAEAQKIGVGPSTLARMWLMERLQAHKATKAKSA